MQPTLHPLSITIITLNAASQIGACLDAVAFADEIVVVDSGSADGTREICHAKGARVIEHDWLGFGRQKQFAVDQATHDWVLCLDADEVVSTELAQDIQAVLRMPGHPGYRMARRNRFLGCWLAHGEGYPDWSLRLFDRRAAHWSDDLVHEKVIPGDSAAAIGTLKGDLLHESAESLETYLNKQNRYTTLQAQVLFAAGRRASISQMLLSPFARFIKFYFFRLGFLDGVPGLAHIAIGCWNSFVKYAKLRELQGRK